MENRESSHKQIVLDVRGFHFHALADGPADGELVMFLHGFPQFADAWLNVMHAAGKAGFRTLAVDQRGYSPEARPHEVSDYAVDELIADIGAFAEALGRRQFRLVGHDWGGLLAWEFAARYPEEVLSLCVLSTPHPDAFFSAKETDEDQKQRSKYISLFRLPGGVAEGVFQADDYQRLRDVYQGILSQAAVSENVRRFAEPGALTAALNWYRAMDFEYRTGKISVPTLYVWGSNDLALGETAALATAQYATGPYRFVRLEGRSHWLLEEAPEISSLIVEHLRSGDHAR